MDQLYFLTKDIHFYLRWIILALAVIVVLKYLMGWLGKKSFTALDNRLSLFFVSAMDIQLLLGLVLYFFLSPITSNVFQSGGNVMKDPDIRFYAIEHPLTMLLAVVFAHVGRVMVKRAGTNELKFKRGTILFTLSLVLMLSRMKW